MKVIGAFVAALSAAAILFALEFLVEGILAGLPLSFSGILFGIGLNLIVGIPAVVIGGVPTWLALRSLRIQSPWAFALAGAGLALCTYLVLLAMGIGQPSDRPMNFWANLNRPFHFPRIAAAMFAGCVGGAVFWRLAVRPCVEDPAA
jgi:hypothetical protein